MSKKRLLVRVGISIVALILLSLAVLFAVRSFAGTNRLESVVSSLLRFPYKDAELTRIENGTDLDQFLPNLSEYLYNRQSDAITETCGKALADEMMYLLVWCRQEEYRSEVVDFTAEQTRSDYGSFDCSVQLIRKDGGIEKTLPMSGRFQLADDGRVGFIEFNNLELMAFAELYYTYFPLQ